MSNRKWEKKGCHGLMRENKKNYSSLKKTISEEN